MYITKRTNKRNINETNTKKNGHLKNKNDRPEKIRKIMQNICSLE